MKEEGDETALRPERARPSPRAAAEMQQCNLSPPGHERLRKCTPWVRACNISGRRDAELHSCTFHDRLAVALLVS